MKNKKNKINWDKLGMKFAVFATFNAFVVPIIIWILFGGKAAKTYFLTLSIGLPYIVVTIGSIFHYNSVEKEKLYYDIKNEESKKSFNNFNLAVKADKEKQTAYEMYIKTKELKEFFDVSGLFMRSLILFFGFIFFFSDAFNWISRKFNNGTQKNNQTIEQPIKSTHLENEAMNKVAIMKLDSLTNRIELLESKLDELSKTNPKEKIKIVGPKNSNY